jgi:DNA-binding PadR family transcriptional regulator
MHGHGCGSRSSEERWFAGGRGGWWGFDPSSAGAFWSGGGRRGPKGGPGRGRLFEQGDLKYVILRLLEEKPRHGYEVIKELEERFSGAYSPSPGTVYPTLAMLEDMGYARVAQDETGRKIYEITDAGRAYLAEHKETVEDIFERIARFGTGFFSDAMREVHSAFGDVARATYSTASKHSNDSTLIQRIGEILKATARQIEEVANEQRTKSQ